MAWIVRARFFIPVLMVFSASAFSASGPAPETLTVLPDEQGFTLLQDHGLTFASIHPDVFTDGWISHSFEAEGPPPDSGVVAHLPGGCDVSMTLSVQVLRMGVRFHYALKPSKSVPVIAVRADIDLTPYEDWQGCAYRMGALCGAVPLTASVDTILAQSNGGELLLGPSAARGGLTVEIDHPSQHTLIQDARQWVDKLDVLVTHGEPFAKPWVWRKGEVKSFDFTLSFNRPVVLSSDLPGLSQLSAVRALHALWFDRDFDKAERCFKVALAKNPDDYENNLDFAMACLTYAHPERAKEAEGYILAAQKKGKDLFNQYLLGIAARDAGDWELFKKSRIVVAVLLRKGNDADIQIRKTDPGFGREQYLAMLDSRPAMKAYVPKEGWLSKWAEGKFSGAGLRRRVLWNGGPTALPTSAETVDDADAACDMELRINPRPPDKDELAMAEEYWESFVFEMLNNQHRERSTWIWMRSRSAGLSDVEYGSMNRSFEQRTDEAVTRFYFEHWKPYCDSMGLPSHPEFWSPANVYPEEALYRVFTRSDGAYLDSAKK